MVFAYYVCFYFWYLGCSLGNTFIPTPTLMREDLWESVGNHVFVSLGLA